MKKTVELLALSTLCMCGLAVVGCQDDTLEGAEGIRQKSESLVSLSHEESAVLEAALSGSYKRDMCAIEELAGNFPFSEGNKSLRFVANAFPIMSENYGGVKSAVVGDLNMDTLAYVVNFADNMGCAIVPVDIRVPEDVLFFSEEGNIPDSIDDAGFALFLDMAADYIERSVAEVSEREDSVRKSLCVALGVANLDELASPGEGNRAVGNTVRYDFVEQVKPQSVVEWGQRHNEYTKSRGCNGNAPYTGCVPTALAQIMAYYKHPKTIGGLEVRWNDLIKYSDSHDSQQSRCDVLPNAHWLYGPSSHSSEKNEICDHLAHLMERICTEVVPSGKYDCDGTASNFDEACEFLSQSYKFQGDYEYNADRIVSSIKNKRLVYGQGCAFKNLKRRGILKSKYYYDGCHAWVYDGFIRMENRSTTYGGRTPVTSVSRRCDYFHINWGWNGVCNGYFTSGVFDDANMSFESGKVVEQKGGRATSSEGAKRPGRLKSVDAEADREGLYRYKLQVITEIFPK